MKYRHSDQTFDEPSIEVKENTKTFSMALKTGTKSQDVSKPATKKIDLGAATNYGKPNKTVSGIHSPTHTETKSNTNNNLMDDMFKTCSVKKQIETDDFVDFNPRATETKDFEKDINSGDDFGDFESVFKLNPSSSNVHEDSTENFADFQSAFDSIPSNSVDVFSDSASIPLTDTIQHTNTFDLLVSPLQVGPISTKGTPSNTDLLSELSDLTLTTNSAFTVNTGKLNQFICT